MPSAKITKRIIDFAKAEPRKRLFLYDEELRGFGLTVTPAGSKSYFVEYRNGSGRRAPTRRMTLGSAGRLTPDEARKLARVTLAEVARGGDPASKRSARRKEQTIAELGERFVEEHLRRHNKPRSAAEAERLLRRTILPSLGHIKISDLKRADVKRWHAGLHSAPYSANRAVATLRKMMNLACRDWELREDNPVTGLKLYPERKRERFFSDADLAEIGQALADMEAENAHAPWFILATRLLALTGMRLGEVLTLRWGDVDLTAGVVRLADAKSGARTVPLNGATIALLGEAQQGGEFVCAGPGARKPFDRFGYYHFWRRLQARTSIKGARPHDFRHTAGTYAAQGGANAFMIRDFMGHKTIAMTGRYVARAADPIKAVAESVGSRVAGAMSGQSAVILVHKTSRRSSLN